MNNVKVNVVSRVDTKINGTGRTIFVDEWNVELDKEQYGRLKASYNTGKFKYLHEDSEIADIYRLYVGEDDEEFYSEYLVNFPIEIKNNLPFESLPKVKEEITEYDESSYSDDSNTEDDLFDFSDEDLEQFEAFENTLNELNDWMNNKGFIRGEFYNHGFDLYWEFGVFGLQRSFTRPIGLILRAPDEKDIKAAEDNGYLCFTDIEKFKDYIQKTYLGGKK